MEIKCDRCRRLKRGNTELLECIIHLLSKHFVVVDGRINRGFIEAHHDAIKILVQAGLAVPYLNGEYYEILWDELGKRKAEGI